MKGGFIPTIQEFRIAAKINLKQCQLNQVRILLLQFRTIRFNYIFISTYINMSIINSKEIIFREI